MKPQIIISFALAFFITMSLSACSTPATQEELTEDILVGTWYVTGVQYEDELIPLSQNDMLSDMFDTHILAINSDGTYSSMENVFVSKGTWTLSYTENDSRIYSFTEESSGMMRYQDGEIATEYQPSSGEFIVGVSTQAPDVLLLREDNSTDFDLIYGRDGETPAIPEDDIPSTPSSQESTVQTPSATRGEMNALDTAKSYLRVSAFSYSGLIDQLEYEGYSHSEAVYGADHCGADWYDQAAKCAAQYLDVMSFSRQGLIEQLEYEGFTYDQAVHGVDQVY